MKRDVGDGHAMQPRLDDGDAIENRQRAYERIAAQVLLEHGANLAIMRVRVSVRRVRMARVVRRMLRVMMVRMRLRRVMQMRPDLTMRRVRVIVRRVIVIVVRMIVSVVRMIVSVVRMIVSVVRVIVSVMRVRVIVMRRRVVDEHVNLRAHQGAALHALARQPIVRERQLRQLGAHDLLGHAQVEQRAQRHVTRDARETVEIQLGALQLTHVYRVFRLMSDAA